MAWDNVLFTLSFPAAEDLSDYQYHFVKIDSGTARLLDSAAEKADGILQNCPTAGEGASVALYGVSKLVANGALALDIFVKGEYVGAADAGKGEDAGANWALARAKVVEASSAEDEFCSVLLIDNIDNSLGGMIQQTTVTTLATAGAATLTAAQILGGLILRDPAGGARTDTLPTATLLAAAMVQAGVGNSFEFTVRNTADAAETITIAAGTDGTTSGTMTIAQNNTKRFKVVITADTPTYDVYSLGTVVH